MLIEHQHPNSQITTFSGRVVDLENVKVEDIHIIDIAHGLSNICRFTGQCRKFYSVAQHSVIVSEIVPKEIALEGLLHDATEAYITDVSRPLKRLLPKYKEIENEISKVIAKAFGLSFLEKEVHDKIKIADNILVNTEKRDLMPVVINSAPCSAGIAAPLKERIVPFSPSFARDIFLKRFAELI